MPKAEAGSTKQIANKMKAKGLQRLRWYCQICEKQCRDENGFKQHTMSEGHVRAMLTVGEDPKKYINQYSEQFKRDFVNLLKTSHGEKKIHMNQFYQEYIRDKEHVHMNATKWPSLTEFAKFLAKEGICRVEEGERGLEVAWIDDSVAAVQRREDIRKAERRIKGDEDMEAKLLERQIKRAKEEAEKREQERAKEQPQETSEDAVKEPVKVSLSLGGKAEKKQEAPKEQAADAPVEISTFSSADNPADKTPKEEAPKETAEAKPKMSLTLAGKHKPANPLMKKANPLAKKKEPAPAFQQEKKMSNAEKIMREELERKRKADERGGGGKRQCMG